MTIYGYHHPNADGRLFLSTCRPKIIKSKYDHDHDTVDDGFDGHIGWIDDAAEKIGVKPGEYVKFELVRGEAKKMPRAEE